MTQSPGTEWYNITMNLGIEIDEEFQKHFKEERLQKLVERCLKIHEFDSGVELSLLITGDETVRELNHSYRGLDETTDVLSFALTEGDADSSPFVTPPDDILHLGEVIVSYPQAERQAKSVGHDVNQEVDLLVVHGVLHLLGYDHAEPEEEQEMKGLEQEILGSMTKQQANL